MWNMLVYNGKIEYLSDIILCCKCCVWFLRYVQYFHEMRHDIKGCQDQNSAQSKVSTSASSTDFAEERVVVGFGPYNMSFFDLFHSPEDEHKRYVKSILQINISHPDGQMDKLKNYIQTQQRLVGRKSKWSVARSIGWWNRTTCSWFTIKFKSVNRRVACATATTCYPFGTFKCTRKGNTIFYIHHVLKPCRESEQ